MSLPDLPALQKGDAAAWNEASDWLWPTVASVAHSKLHPHLPNEIEDVALEALEELLEKVRSVKSSEELKPFRWRPDGCHSAPSATLRVT